VGLDGPGEAAVRRGAGIGAGWDQFGGHGRDAYPFLEAFGHVEARVWRRLAVGGGLSVRRDVADYNFALARWRGGSTGLAAQVFVGYDGPCLHFGGGMLLLGDDRDGRAFRPGLLTHAVWRLRVGRQDGWHGSLRILDGAPFVAAGGATGLRILVGAPPWGRHRAQAGVYTSIGEMTAGLAAYDEIEGAGPRGTALRLGLLAGTDVFHPARVELTSFVGLAW
jgi:hypothetical protein